jgi:hypothetical protein
MRILKKKLLRHLLHMYQSKSFISIGIEHEYIKAVHKQPLGSSENIITASATPMGGFLNKRTASEKSQWAVF